VANNEQVSLREVATRLQPLTVPCPECGRFSFLQVRAMYATPQGVVALPDGPTSVKMQGQGFEMLRFCLYCFYRELYDIDPVTKQWRLREALKLSLSVSQETQEPAE
jgi:hypothetical protein